MIINICSISKVTAQNYGSVSFDVFYNELSPYGYWDHDSNYGDIWFPNVDSNFRPYGSNVYWTMTQYGNTWVSHYPWGWAPFHYGRWVHTRYNGWGWIPGYEWGPAWVDWRSGNGYYGWAPMAPRVNVNVSIGLPIDLWIFAPSRRIYDHNIYNHSHYGRPNIYNNTTIINNTYIVNNNHYYGGPSRRDVERSTGRRVTVRDIQNAQRPGTSRVDNRTVSMYRPDRNNSSKNDHTPSRVNTNDRNTSRVNTIDRNNSRVNTNDRNNSTRNNSNVRSQREMYIGKDGKSSVRENSNYSTNQTSTDNRSSVNPNRANTSRTETSRKTTADRTNREQIRIKQNELSAPQRRRTPNRESPNRSTRSSSIIHSVSRSNTGNERRQIENGTTSRIERSNTSNTSNANTRRESNEQGGSRIRR